MKNANTILKTMKLNVNIMALVNLKSVFKDICMKKNNKLIILIYLFVCLQFSLYAADTSKVETEKLKSWMVAVNNEIKSLKARIKALEEEIAILKQSNNDKSSSNSYLNSSPSARTNACLANMRTYSAAVKMYNFDHDESPMKSLNIEELVKEKYINSVLTKPEKDCNYSSEGDLTSGFRG